MRKVHEVALGRLNARYILKFVLHVPFTTRKKNKARYTANTSRGRMSRGGNARFYTFQLDHHGPTDIRTKPLKESLVRRLEVSNLRLQVHQKIISKTKAVLRNYGLLHRALSDFSCNPIWFGKSFLRLPQASRRIHFDRACCNLFSL